MRVIDEQGNLFGAVNVIDALAVVVALAVVAAGVAVLGSTNDPTASRDVTVELDDQPASVAERISEGDVMALDGENLTITDVYVGPGSGADASVTVAARVVGTEGSGGSTIQFGGDAVRPGRTIEIGTDQYEVTGTITDVHRERTRLDEGTTTVTVSSSVDDAVAGAIEAGDTYELAGREVGTVDAVSVFPTTDGERRRVLLDLELATLRDADGSRFGSRRVRAGDNLTFATDDYALVGTVLPWGGPGDDATTDTVTAVVRLENVEPTVADAIDVGDEERTRGTTYARVTDKRVEPAVVVLTSVDGDIHQREHPRNKDVFLTVELTVIETPDGPRFHGERLRQGTDVVLDFDTIVVNGTVVALEGDA